MLLSSWFKRFVMGGTAKKKRSKGSAGRRRGRGEKARREEEESRCPITHQHLRTLKEVGLLGTLWPAERLVSMSRLNQHELWL